MDNPAASPAEEKALTAEKRIAILRAAHLDGKRVSQILYNLVSNAVKYSPEGTPVTVRHSGDDRQVTIQVEDRGSGFSPEQRAHMFLPFSQAHRGILDVPGTGLGLFTCVLPVQGESGAEDVAV